jgi:hypothetical protein
MQAAAEQCRRRCLAAARGIRLGRVGSDATICRREFPRGENGRRGHHAHARRRTPRLRESAVGAAPDGNRAGAHQREKPRARRQRGGPPTSAAYVAPFFAGGSLMERAASSGIVF